MLLPPKYCHVTKHEDPESETNQHVKPPDSRGSQRLVVTKYVSSVSIQLRTTKKRTIDGIGDMRDVLVCYNVFSLGSQLIP